MTPTLLGRWQTRYFLLSTVGLIITFLFYSGLLGSHNGSLTYLAKIEGSSGEVQGEAIVFLSTPLKLF